MITLVTKQTAVGTMDIFIRLDNEGVGLQITICATFC